MTDNEIIKALECCCEAELNEDCKKLKCPFFDYEIDNCTNVGDMDAMYRFALDLINRQKAEIERLKAELKEDSRVMKQALVLVDEIKKEIAVDIETAKVEAVKEFAERLKEKERPTFPLAMVVDISEIDNLVKEMVGEG